MIFSKPTEENEEDYDETTDDTTDTTSLKVFDS